MNPAKPRVASGTGEIPDRALALEGPGVVSDGAVHKKAAVGTKHEGHEGLAGRLILCCRGWIGNSEVVYRRRGVRGCAQS